MAIVVISGWMIIASIFHLMKVMMIMFTKDLRRRDCGTVEMF